MKLKYYLRGLGVGIVVTTLILLIVFNTTGKNISDDEIKARAKELGMVEKEVEDTTSGKLLDSFGKDNTDDSSTSDNSADANADSTTDVDAADEEDKADDNASTDNTDVDSSGETDTDTTDDVESDDKTDVTDESNADANASDTDNDGVTSTTEEGDDNTETVEEVKNPNLLHPGQRAKISVVPGDVSRTVSDKLYEVGLIEDADEFNKFMQDTGSDDYIKVGDYNIVAGATYDEIASILTR